MATENKLQELASQLRMPQGDKGTDIGKMMQETNSGMIQDAVEHLHLCSGDHILELGHGNGQHIPDLLKRQPDLRYTGLEISPLMQQESIAANEKAIASGKAAFFIYDGNTLPFAPAAFTKIFTVNTIYFWHDASHIFKELARVSMTAATLVITFMEADYLKSMPFSQYGFRFYSSATIEQLLSDTPWLIADRHTTSEKIQGPKQTPIVRPYITLILQK